MGDSRRPEPLPIRRQRSQQETPGCLPGGASAILACRSISRKEAQDAISQWHYLGGKPFRASACFGLFLGDVLVGAIVFHGLSAPETAVGAFGLARNEQQGFFEIGRLALSPAYNGGNLGSFFIWKAMRRLRTLTTVRAVIAYADSTLHSGGIYRAANFTYYGLTAPKKDYYREGRIVERGPRQGCERRPRPRKHRYMIVFDPKLEVRWIQA